MKEAALLFLKEKLAETKDEALLKEAEAKVDCWLKAWEPESTGLSQLLADDAESVGRKQLHNWLTKYLGDHAPKDESSEPPPLTERQAALIDKLVFSPFKRDLPYFRNKLLEYIFISSYRFIEPAELKLAVKEPPNLLLLNEVITSYQERLFRAAVARDKGFISGEAADFTSIFTEEEKRGEPTKKQEDINQTEESEEEPKSLLGKIFDLIYSPGSPYFVKRALLPLALLRELRNYFSGMVDSLPPHLVKRSSFPLLSGKFSALKYLPLATKNKLVDFSTRLELLIRIYALLALIEKKNKVSIEHKKRNIEKAYNWNKERLIDFLSEMDKEFRLLHHIRVNEERILSEVGTKIKWEHLARYRLLAQLFSGEETVLDAGCGVGLGAELISKKVKRVFALDRAYPSFIDKKNNRVSFAGGDLFHLPFNGKRFDAILLLEVIEHLQKPDEVMEELLPLLADDGFLALSTPNGDFYSPGLPLPWNPFHHREYNLDELTEFLSPYFRDIEVYGEHLAPQIEPGLSLPFSFIIGEYTASDFPITKDDLKSAMSFIVICRGKKGNERR